MSIVDSIRKDMFEAKSGGDSVKSEILSMTLASIKNVEIDKGELSEENIVEIIRKEVKKLEDAYKLYTDGGRDDLASREKEQLDILNTYIPALMGEEEVREVVNKVVEGMPNATIRDMGIVMGSAMKELKGKADGNLVSQIVKDTLSSR